MTVAEYLGRWRETGAITPDQYDTLLPLVQQTRFSLFAELNTLLYAGIVAAVTGIGWTVQAHFASLGDAAVVLALSATFLASLWYCFSRVQPYSDAKVEAPTFAFDYVLYLGCLTFGVELGFLEYRFHLLQAHWDNYLLLSSALYFALAYRFDNRLVLSLALSTLAAWFGIRVSQIELFRVYALRTDAMMYGAIVAGTGALLYKIGVKKHFLETYLHVAATVLFIALLSGVIDRAQAELFLVALLSASGLAIWGGIRLKKFAFVLYGIVYGYIGISARLLREIETFTAATAYLVISGSAVLVSLVVLARRFGRDE